MSDQPRHKTSLEVDKEIEDDFKANGFVRPAIIMPMMGGATFSSWVEIALGRRPPRPVVQPNPLISKWKHDWARSHNNNRELGPGDVKKR